MKWCVYVGGGLFASFAVLVFARSVSFLDASSFVSR